MLAQALGAERLRLNAAVEHFGETAEGVWLELQSGIRVHGDVLVGADGLRSRVRAKLHGDSPPVYAGYTAWRGVAPLPPGGILAGETWGRGCRFGQVPLRRERVYWFAAANAAEGARSADGEQRALLRMFRGWHAPIETLIASTPEEEILRNDIYDRPPLTTPWNRGRVTLLGDAAHPMTPNLGQGACQALEDAVVLARCLSGSLPPAGALAAYERVRRPRVDAIVKESRQVGRIAQWQHPVAVRLRDFLVRVMPARVQERRLEAIVGYDVNTAAPG
jgi:2-polyprenyl-6-methoxyphenol hydroxylase-like FAD-dependent oxidoreductase